MPIVWDSILDYKLHEGLDLFVRCYIPSAFKIILGMWTPDSH